jgi:hypothetical protein
MSYDNLKAGNNVIFNVKTTVIKSSFYGVTVEAIATASIAQKIKDVKSLHLQVKPYISGLPNNYDDYSYVIVRMPNGDTEVIGLPWIVETSIQISSKRNYQLILDDIEPEQVEIIRNALVNRGVKIRSFTEYH